MGNVLILICPWCSSEEFFIVNAVVNEYYVKCMCCESQGPIGNDRNDAVNKWNELKYATRKIERKLPESIGDKGIPQLRHHDIQRGIGVR